MPDENIPNQPQAVNPPPQSNPQPAATTPPVTPRATTPPLSAPAPGEPYRDFASARRNLPPAVPVALAIVLVAVVVGIFAYTERAKPAAQGAIDGAYFSQPANVTTPMILLEVTLRNTGDKTLYIKSLKASVKTPEGEQSDEAAAASDFDRYLLAYPDLKGHSRPLAVEMKIPPGAEQKGTVLVSIPLSQQQFDARQDISVTVEPYDQRPVVLHEKAAAAN